MSTMLDQLCSPLPDTLQSHTQTSVNVPKTDVQTNVNVPKTDVQTTVNVQKTDVQTTVNIPKADVDQVLEKNGVHTVMTVDQEKTKDACTILPLPRMNITNTGTSLTETWSLCNDHEKAEKIPVPSKAVVDFVKGFFKPEVISFMRHVVDHFDNSGCTHQNHDDCFEVNASSQDLEDQSYVLTDLDHVTNTCTPIEPFHPGISTSHKYSTPVMSVPRYNLKTPDTPISSFSACSSQSSMYNSETSFMDVQKQKSAGEAECLPPKKTVSSCNPDPEQEMPHPVVTLRRSPRKSLQFSQAADDMDHQDILLKMYPNVKVRPEKLSSAIAAATKSSKPGYTLCYNLIAAVFGVEELANSRGQGLSKPKDGDIRPVLDKSKSAAVKEYTMRWCKKFDKPLPKEAELNNAFTEQVSHCRKKLKKAMKN